MLIAGTGLLMSVGIFMGSLMVYFTVFVTTMGIYLSLYMSAFAAFMLILFG